MSYYAYILIGTSKKRVKTYVGWTNNLQKRLKKHNAGKGAKSTRGYKWKIIYYKRYARKQEAMKNEYYLKKISPLRKILKLKHNK
tara:strand:- start:235 stop:489 length:255 start_codon:yes stop_codon:yes gene_type:complete